MRDMVHFFPFALRTASHLCDDVSRILLYTTMYVCMLYTHMT